MKGYQRYIEITTKRPDLLLSLHTSSVLSPYHQDPVHNISVNFTHNFIVRCCVCKASASDCTQSGKTNLNCYSQHEKKVKLY